MEGFVREALSRRAIHIVALALVSVLNGSCDPCDSSLDPVKCSDLCEQPTPHKDCAKCTSIPRDASCPQCNGPSPLADCENYRGADGSVNDASADADADAMSGGEGGVSGIGGTGGMGGGGGSGGMGVSGGMGGSGGTGGVVGVVCETHANCPPAQAVCGDDDRCGPCTDEDDCARHAGALVCDVREDVPTSGRCVDCLNDNECSSANGHECVLGFCVECETDVECTSLETPQCSTSYQCEGCKDNDACVGRGVRSMCDTRDGAENEGECVECEAHSDCEDAEKPQCDATGTCVPCSGNDDACEDRSSDGTATPYCNTRADADTFGQCVQCTGATEAVACADDKSCRQDDGRCTGTDVGSREPCETCEADSECGDGMACVDVTLGLAPANQFCLYRFSVNDGCAAMNRLLVRPFSVTAEHASVDAPAEDFCLPTSTCEAYRSAVDEVECTLTTDCGADDVADGECPDEGGAPNKCSYDCNFDWQCPDTLPHCDNFCQPAP